MALCSNQGLDINLDYSDKEQIIPKLFSEEIGFVIEVKNEKFESVRSYLIEKELFFENVAKKNNDKKININCFKEEVFSEDLITLFNQWSKVSHEIQKIRDSEDTALAEKAAYEKFDKFLTPEINFLIPKPDKNLFRKRPKIALIREQGINGQYDMAAALMEAGFEVKDLHMSEFGSSIKELDSYRGLVVPGGFSYGDVLGAGSGMSNTILFLSLIHISEPTRPR